MTQQHLDLFRRLLAHAVRVRVARLHARGGVTPLDYIGLAATVDLLGQRSSGSRPDDATTVRAFHRLADALAVLSFSSGGIDFFGLHFEESSAPSSVQ